jgi:hypothetical protein
LQIVSREVESRPRLGSFSISYKRDFHFTSSPPSAPAEPVHRTADEATS